MLKSFRLDQFTGSLEEMVDLYIEEKMLYVYVHVINNFKNIYSDNSILRYNSWWGHVNEYAVSNIHFVHYEKLVEVIFHIIFQK
jgi:hypothetical protein